MDKYQIRDLILQKLHEMRDEQPAPINLLPEIGIEGLTVEQVAEEYEWLFNNDLINNDSRPALTALGVHYVELGISVKELAKSKVQNHIQQQYQYNFGGQNQQAAGEQVSLTQNNNSSDEIDKIISILEEAQERKKAAEIRDLAKQGGAISAFRKVGHWISERVFSSAVMAELAAIVFKSIQN
jgi:hypothetical protein